MSRERQALQHLFELVEAGIPPSAETLAQCRAALEPERFVYLTSEDLQRAHGDQSDRVHRAVELALRRIVAGTAYGRVRLKLPNGHHLIIEREKRNV